MGFTQIIKKQLFATILSDDALNPIYLIFIHFGSKKKKNVIGNGLYLTVI